MPSFAGVDAGVVVELISENITRQYALTPVKSTTVSLTTTPKLTSGRYLTPMLSIIGRRNAVVAQLPPPGMDFAAEEKERDSDSAGRNEVDRAK